MPTTAARAPEAPWATSSASERAEFWRATFRVWTIAFVVGMALAAVTVVVQVSDTGTRVRAVFLLGGIVAAFAFLAVPGVRRGSSRLAHAYLAVTTLLTSLSVLNAPISVVLLFIVYAHVWFFGTTRRVSLLFTLLMTLGVFGSFAWRGSFTAAATHDAVVQGAFAAVFATLLGLWVTYIAEQSEVRAELIDQLASAQDELARASHDAGVTAERERMAREIHDTLAQGLASIVMLAQTTEAELERGAVQEAGARVGLIEATARENLAEARALVAAFAPVALVGSSLVEALDRLAARFAAETGVAVEVDHERRDAALSREHEVVMLRVAQEALTNVRRHARASSVRLRLDVADEVVLEVCDDGLGMSPDNVEGFGLRGMRDRVRTADGAIDLETSPGGGTIVRARLPRRDEEGT